MAEENLDKMSPEQAQMVISEIMAEAMKDPQHPYINPKDPRHKAAIDGMSRLFRIKNRGRNQPTESSSLETIRAKGNITINEPCNSERAERFNKLINDEDWLRRLQREVMGVAAPEAQIA